MNFHLFEPIARTNANWDPFHEFFLWLARNNTDWCVTAGNYYEEMLLGTGYCPGSGRGPVSKDFCTDFVNAYVSKCVKEDSAQLDNQAMVAVFVLALSFQSPPSASSLVLFLERSSTPPPNKTPHPLLLNPPFSF